MKWLSLRKLNDMLFSSESSVHHTKSKKKISSKKAKAIALREKLENEGN